MSIFDFGSLIHSTNKKQIEENKRREQELNKAKARKTYQLFYEAYINNQEQWKASLSRGKPFYTLAYCRYLLSYENTGVLDGLQLFWNKYRDESQEIRKEIGNLLKHNFQLEIQFIREHYNCDCKIPDHFGYFGNSQHPDSYILIPIKRSDSNTPDDIEGARDGYTKKFD